mmetsp:Transcript_31710/g.45041  ORF Transcript_31710/g.45041 Transcript_31710/m.45041 type:complete len:255 (-) Transcript_31710:882-1646(-)|eukprot:CAMPEP_0202462160 /NCGR_PEP_ID=MMETSP1360-20130828/52739_1 /ASSEMBLY_ACC=CAM_ASM_000848 /TAXON_ID=515479 /ORGANISM="Licmophora paradoxa, Strain CCMP2313" /LENGTH=254 /DNA_ID=CAMNT_0049084503 /DNA_START=179 /DNA_END=943 /DNA_ORIENTATION=+
MLTCLCTIFLTVLRCIRCGYVVQDHESSYDGTQKTEQETHWDAPKNKREDPDRFLGADEPDDEHFHYKYPECEGLYSNVFVLVLAIVALAFLIFTCSMLLDQIDAITSNTSKIARMKMKIGQGGTELERVSHDFNEMFGGDSPRPAWHWFLPLSVRFPSDMEQVVLGYDWDPTYEGEPFQEDDMVAALESKEETLAVGGPPPRDIDIECGKIVAEEDGSVSDESESFHNTAAKKRSGKKEDNPTFVGSTKNRLT